jgi:hypothetical protein
MEEIRLSKNNYRRFTMIFEWKEGSSFNADANKIGFELKEIGDKISPDDVVEKAKNEKSELNKCFEWDNNVAAESYRRDQARKLLRSIVIVKQNENDDEIPERQNVNFTIRAYENVTCGNDGRKYVETEKILQNQDWREELFMEILKEIGSLKRKIQKYESLSLTLYRVRENLDIAENIINNRAKNNGKFVPMEIK